MPVTTPPTAANSAHTDANQQFSIIGVAGTLGTADLAGTSPTVPIGVNPLTGAAYVQDLSGYLPVNTQSTFGTLGTTGATVFGTLAGGTSSGAGTQLFVSSISLTIPSTAGSQDVSIGFGTNAGTFHSGTSRLVRGNFPAGGGIQKTFVPPINSGTNAQLCYFQAGAGSVNIDVTFFTTTSTL